MNMKDLQTPCFVIDQDFLDEGIQKMKAALEKTWGNYIIGYSYKTNTLPWVVKHVDEQGCYAEVVSDDEYHLALAMGVDKHHMIYNGVAKSKETFLDAVRNHAVVNIDAEYEIDWLDALADGEYKVGIRANFDLESACPGQTQCGEDGERFGFCYENGELKRAIDRIREKGIQINGLHLHKSSKTRMPDIYRAIAEAAVEIAEEYALDLEYVDIGGGFFGGLDWKPQFPEYFQLVSSILRRRFDPAHTLLIVEPGMALIGAAVDYLTTVLDVKKTTRNTFLITDGSRVHIDPLMTKSFYFHDILRTEGAAKETVSRQIVSGFTCMEHDRLFEIKDEPQLIPGDRIHYHKVGAYTMCLSPLFIKWFPDVYVKSGEEITKVRTRWDADAYRNGR